MGRVNNLLYAPLGFLNTLRFGSSVKSTVVELKARSSGKGSIVINPSLRAIFISRSVRITPPPLALSWREIPRLSKSHPRSLLAAQPKNVQAHCQQESRRLMFHPLGNA